MKQRHIILNQNSHGVYFCICGATWKAQEKPSKPCPASIPTNILLKGLDKPV